MKRDPKGGAPERRVGRVPPFYELYLSRPERGLKAFLRAVRDASQGHKAEMYQVERRQTRYDYTQGPMYFLGQQIVRAMQDAGHPAKIVFCYRSPQHQQRLYEKGRTTPGAIVTKARPGQSPHQFYEAVDIVHAQLNWDASPAFWDQLARCVQVVAEKFGVELEHGHNWTFRDSAHIELADWREFRRQMTNAQGQWTVPGAVDLAYRFEQVLPKVWKQATRNGEPTQVATQRSGEMARDHLECAERGNR